MHIDRDLALGAFRAYVAFYDATNPRIALKVKHTLYAAELAERIARSEGMTHDDVDLAWLCGLLHDMGRFEQLRRWNTFSDAKSTSHAALGVEVLFAQRAGVAPFEEDVATNSSEPLTNTSIRLRNFVTDTAEDECIRAAIAYHSDFRLPEGLSERTRTYCNIVRDADKLDILRVTTDSTAETMLAATAEELRASQVSPAALAAFNEHRCVKRNERTYPADYVIGFLCFPFELVFPESRRIAREDGYVFRLADQPLDMKGAFEREDTRAAFKRMAVELHTWLARD